MAAKIEVRRAVSAAVVAGLAVVFLVTAAPFLDERFGQSEDGLNAAVWGRGTRALRESGLIDSRLGARTDEGKVYANHPPLLVIETAAIESALGEHRWTTRSSAALSTVAAIALLYFLLRECFDRGAALAGTAVAATTPMLLGFGFMLDTPVTSLPFGLAVLTAWQRLRNGRPWPAWVTGVVAALACLSGWQATLTVAAVTVAVAVTARRAGRRSLADAAPFALGGLVGVTSSIGWIAWAYGGLGPLLDQFRSRTGGTESATTLELVRTQLDSIASLLGLAVLGLLGLFLALKDARTRAISTMAVSIVVAYSLLFRNALVHVYWNYWIVVPAAIGTAALVQALLRRYRSTAVALAVVALVVVAMVVDLRGPSPTNRLTFGVKAADAMAAAHLPDDQTSVAYLGAIYEPQPWLEYETGRPAWELTEPAALRTLAQQEPNSMVLLVGSCDEGDAGALCRRVWAGRQSAGERVDDFVAATAADLQAAFDRATDATS